MLKLEKSSKNSEIHIRVRPSKSRFDRQFLWAFSLALGMHLLAAILFHIRLFSLGENESVLPATKTLAHFVKSSVNDKDAIVSAQPNMEGRLTPAQLAPPSSFPNLKLLNPHI